MALQIYIHEFFPVPIVRGEMVKKQSNRALCDTILKFGMVLGYAMGITKTTGYKLASPSGGQ